MTPWSAAAHFENWGDSGSSSPPARQTAHRRRHGGGGAMAQSVDGHDNSLPACKVEPRDHKRRGGLRKTRGGPEKPDEEEVRTLWSWKTAGPSCPILSRSFKGQGSRGCSLQVDAPEIMDAPLEADDLFFFSFTLLSSCSLNSDPVQCKA
ncbi:Transcription factor PERIANTHIA [Zea mays]|uniref:Transcription factor PERIANTHIA n=1 Tax=Zea mays TaxID=4577 RepID=A0A1D6LWH3_MAIZE|nr:Transcription factor PERIANTHIA [Zea mays]